MQALTRFYVALIPAILLVIVAEATVPALIANLAVWMIGEGVLTGLIYLVFWLAAFVSILITSVNALMRIEIEIRTGAPPEQDRPRVVAMPFFTRRGPR